MKRKFYATIRATADIIVEVEADSLEEAERLADLEADNVNIQEADLDHTVEVIVHHITDENNEIDYWPDSGLTLGQLGEEDLT